MAKNAIDQPPSVASALGRAAGIGMVTTLVVGAAGFVAIWLMLRRKGDDVSPPCSLREGGCEVHGSPTD